MNSIKRYEQITEQQTEIRVLSRILDVIKLVDTLQSAKQIITNDLKQKIEEIKKQQDCTHKFKHTQVNTQLTCTECGAYIPK